MRVAARPIGWPPAEKPSALTRSGFTPKRRAASRITRRTCWAFWRGAAGRRPSVARETIGEHESGDAAGGESSGGWTGLALDLDASVSPTAGRPHRRAVGAGGDEHLKARRGALPWRAGGIYASPAWGSDRDGRCCAIVAGPDGAAARTACTAKLAKTAINRRRARSDMALASRVAGRRTRGQGTARLAGVRLRFNPAGALSGQRSHENISGWACCHAARCS